MLTRSILTAALLLGFCVPAVAMPKMVVILRHGEKANGQQLCATGTLRANALAATYLGKNATSPLFPGQPDAFFVITPHTLETAAPSFQSWNMQPRNYGVPPLGQSGTSDKDLNKDTKAAFGDLTSHAYDGKTVVIVWEHKHIANRKLQKKYANATWWQLLGLGKLGAPHTWEGGNFDYFWIVTYDKKGKVKSSDFKKVETFTGAFSTVPQNAWGTAEPPLPGCES